ncbi:Tctex-1_family protein [Hexamita inflata]|uniref:Tctex-1 family protein n=1 Tax=Hexamita inflata TaxID=28002 RepID=A0AA86PUF6_9EUKA|nr:Tctex-1 family protein [Hexamita inflata]CAI9941177.1 Tctex-1 family protein [Hexamita inflata]
MSLDMSDQVSQRYNPDPVNKFDSKRVKQILHEALDKKFQNWNYDHLTAITKTKECSKYVFNQLADKDRKTSEKQESTYINLGRYKCICQVYCTQLAGQGVRIASRELWNPNTDNLISETVQGKDFVAVGLFWYVYVE